MPPEQFPVGADVELPAGETRNYRYEVDGTEYVSLVEFEAGTADVVYAAVEFRPEGQDMGQTFPRLPDDGDADPDDDRASGDPDRTTWPIRVSSIIGESRFTLLYQLTQGDAMHFKLNNTDGANARQVRFRAAAASTLEAAVGARRQREQRGGA